MSAEERYVSDLVSFGEQFDHQQLFDAVQSMDVAAVSALSERWAKLGAEAAASIEDLAQRAIRRIGEGWQGSAADAALANIESYRQSAPALQESVSSVAAPLEVVASAVTRLRAEMPEVQPLGWYDKITPWQSNMDREHYRRRDIAFDLMRRHYPPAERTVDESIPVFDELRSTVHHPEAGGPGGGLPGSGSGGGFGGGGSGGGGGGGMAAVPPGSFGPADAAALDGASAADAMATTSGGENGGSGLPGVGDAPAATTAASAGSSLGVGSGAGADGLRSSVGGGGGLGGGAGLGGLGGGGHAGGAVGGGLVGAGPTPAGPGAGAAGAAGGARPGVAGAGARGAMMGGGMMGGAGAGRGGGSDDAEHKTPGYLVTVQNGNELIGGMPPVSPPVIGS